MGRLLTPALILASASPQRRALLRKLKVPFTIAPSLVSERSSEKRPRRLVELLARRKALEISRRHPEAAVLGADTIVVCRGRILGKPRDAAHAFRILKTLNGRWQRVYTGIAFALDGGRRVVSKVALTRVLARRLPEERLKAMAGKHLDMAGAYAVQDKDDPFIARVDGDFDNVVGLPTAEVRALWKKAVVARRRSGSEAS